MRLTIIFQNYQVLIFRIIANQIMLTQLHLFEKLNSTANKVAPLKNIRIKCLTEEWFDGEIIKIIINRDKLLKKYKKSKLTVDLEYYKKDKIQTKNLVHSKNHIMENTGNSKKIWKTLST